MRYLLKVRTMYSVVISGFFLIFFHSFLRKTLSSRSELPMLKVRTTYILAQSRSELCILKVRTTYFIGKSVENCSLKVFVKVRTMYFSRSELCILGLSSRSELCI
jgi:hypothetical protein